MHVSRTDTTAPPRMLRLLALGVALGGPCQAVAQETQVFEAWARAMEIEESGESLSPEDEKYVRDDWFVRVGVMGGAVPGYVGSDNYEGSYTPRLKVVWRDRVFINDRQLGLNLYKDDSFSVGPLLRYTGGRSDSNEGLRGMGHVDRTLDAGAFLNYRLGELRFKSEVRHDALGQGQGTVAIARLGTRVPWGRPIITTYVSTTWASDEHMDTFFGVSAAQSGRTGLRTYNPGGGIRDVSLSVSGGYALDEHWSVGAQLEYQRLLGDAADSPLVRERGSENQYVIGAGVAYTF